MPFNILHHEEDITCAIQRFVLFSFRFLNFEIQKMYFI